MPRLSMANQPTFMSPRNDHISSGSFLVINVYVERFHLMFNLKSKRSSDILEKKRESIDVYILL